MISLILSTIFTCMNAVCLIDLLFFKSKYWLGIILSFIAFIIMYQNTIFLLFKLLE